ncbi:hypothetical protein NL533_33150, partial [Klebsiella pneumoniae]|nr:hypothetical protein [Klebsiella pneumoniae]
SQKTNGINTNNNTEKSEIIYANVSPFMNDARAEPNKLTFDVNGINSTPKRPDSLLLNTNSVGTPTGKVNALNVTELRALGDCVFD